MTPRSGATRSDERLIRHRRSRGSEGRRDFHRTSLEIAPKGSSLGTPIDQFGFHLSNMDDYDFQTNFSRTLGVGETGLSPDRGDTLSFGSLNAGIRVSDRSSDSGINRNFASESFDLEMRLDQAPPMALHDTSIFPQDIGGPGNTSASPVRSDISDLGSLPQPTLESKRNQDEVANSDTPPLPTPGSVSECLQFLSELTLRLHKANEYESNCKTLTDMLSFSPDLPNSQTSPLPKNAIGCVLERSQAFVDTLCTLKTLLSARVSEPGSPTMSECSYSELWETNDFISNEVTNPFAGEQITGVSLSSGSGASTRNDSSHSSARPSIFSSESAATTTLDLPATLIVLTCYTWLLHTYDTILSCIGASLSGAQSNFPSIIPGLTVGGFNVEGRKDLQVEIFSQLSAKMLARIEKILDIGVASVTHLGGAEDSILEATSASALLDVIYRQKDGEQGPATQVRLRMGLIRESLRVSYA